MAEEQGVTDSNNQAGFDAAGMPEAGIYSQYVKDISFENPNSPAVYQWQGQPNIDVQFNIGSQQVGDGAYEVALKIDITATAAEGVAFKLELLYGGLFGLRNIPDEQLQPFLLAEAPRLMFPFARRIVADAISDGGFPPLMLDPIDFGALYMQRAAQAQAEGGDSQAPEITGQA